MKWEVIVCLGGQRPLWVRVRSDAGSMGCTGCKNTPALSDNISVCHKDDRSTQNLGI